MYAQVRKYDAILGGHTAGQVCNDIEQTGVAKFKKIPGFVDYFAVELNDGGLLTITLYDDQAGVEAAKKVSAAWNKTESSGSLPETPDEVFQGEVRIHEPARMKKAVA